ncbi:hypothetical protein GWI34_30235 [Actinomadura sp. DSM 109109]|nr:hypothetical protein [Actinomadura lepetitiana]
MPDMIPGVVDASSSPASTRVGKFFPASRFWTSTPVKARQAAAQSAG